MEIKALSFTRSIFQHSRNISISDFFVDITCTNHMRWESVALNKISEMELYMYKAAIPLALKLWGMKKADFWSIVLEYLRDFQIHTYSNHFHCHCCFLWLVIKIEVKSSVAATLNNKIKWKSVFFLLLFLYIRWNS